MSDLADWVASAPWRAARWGDADAAQTAREGFPAEARPDVTPETWARLKGFADLPASAADPAVCDGLLADPGVPALVDCLALDAARALPVWERLTAARGVDFLGPDLPPFLLAGLGHAADGVRALALRFTPSPPPPLLLPALADALLSGSAAVAEAAAARLVSSSAEGDDAGPVAAELARVLQAGAGGDAELRMRVLDAAVRIDVPAARDAGLLADLGDALRSRDPLLRMVAADLLPLVCASGAGLAHAAEAGWLEQLLADRSGLRVLAELSGAVPATPALLAALRGALAAADGDDEVTGAQLSAGGAVAALFAGGRAGAAAVAADAELLRGFGRLARARGEQRAAVLDSLSRVLANEEEGGQEESKGDDPRAAVAAAVAEATGEESLAAYLLASLALPFADCRVAALRASVALVEAPGGWGLRAFASQPGALEFLQRPCDVNTKASRQWRFALLQAIAQHPAADASVDAAVLGRVRELEAQGPFARRGEEVVEVAEAIE